MQANYSREFGSQFPNSLINMPELKDLDDSIKDIVKQYYTFLLNGNYDGALNLYSANKGYLKQYSITEEWFNLIQEELANIQIFALLLRNTVIDDAQPDLNYDEGSVWIQPLELVEV